jgi:hypothetical protein
MLVNWLFLFLDELCCPGYRQQKIDEPLFILGPPRSGTTRLHRVLAADRERFTTTSAIEAFFAPSVIQKRALKGLKRLDDRIGGPLRRLLAALETRGTGRLHDMHPGGAADPEEDFYFLLAHQSCFGLALFFPRWPGFHDLMLAEHPAARGARREAIAFYRLMLQKHCHVFGGGRVLLSKNASFAAWTAPLLEAFPTARVLCLNRPPSETVPSMLSLADHQRRAAAAEGGDSDFHDLMLEVMRAHYRGLADHLRGHPPERRRVIDRRQLRDYPEACVREAYHRFGWTPSGRFRTCLCVFRNEARGFVSRHHYSARDFGLDGPSLDAEFPSIPEAE